MKIYYYFSSSNGMTLEVTMCQIPPFSYIVLGVTMCQIPPITWLWRLRFVRSLTVSQTPVARPGYRNRPSPQANPLPPAPTLHQTKTLEKKMQQTPQQPKPLQPAQPVQPTQPTQSGGGWGSPAPRPVAAKKVRWFPDNDPLFALDYLRGPVILYSYVVSQQSMNSDRDKSWPINHIISSGKSVKIYPYTCAPHGI